MFGTLMLDSEGDLIEAVETSGGMQYTTIAVAQGSQQVAQALSLNASTKRNDAWFNLLTGIDYAGLFYDTNRSDAALDPLRSQAFRLALEETPGFGSYKDSSSVTFTRRGRTLHTSLPCVIIDCDNSQTIPVVIG